MSGVILLNESLNSEKRKPIPRNQNQKSQFIQNTKQKVFRLQENFKFLNLKCKLWLKCKRVSVLLAFQSDVHFNSQPTSNQNGRTLLPTKIFCSSKIYI